MSTWKVDVLLTEDDGRTRAEAVLHSDADRELHGVGQARRNPRDADVPEIGDELATSRALSELSHLLLDAAAADIEAATGKEAHLRG